MNRQLTALATSIAALAGVWTGIAFAVPMLGPVPFVLWPTFVSWAAFFYAGANREGLRNGAVQLATGAAISFAVMSVYNMAGAPGPAPLAFGLLVFAIAWPITMLSGVHKMWAQVPAGFLGAAAYFGVSAAVPADMAWGPLHLAATLFPLMAGEMLGYASSTLAAMAAPAKSEAAPAGAAVAAK
jgi:hypothetical protein